jgi:hypothetical protein
MPDPIAAYGGGDLQNLIRQQLRLLEVVFEDSDLAKLRARHPEHPAVKQYDRLVSLSERGLLWPNDFESVNAFSTVGLDFLTWTPQSPQADIWEVVGKGKSTVPMLKSPSQYQDEMAELFVLGWLAGQGVPSRRIDVVGKPDVLVNEEWPIEVKRLHVGAGSNRINEVLKKANSQIKNVNPDGGGSVYIGVERNPRRQAFDDRIPNDVLPVVEAVRSGLNRGLLRSVTHVIIGWDDVLVVGEPPGRVVYAFRRRSTLVTHPEPRVPPQFSREQLEFGRTVTAAVEYSGVNIPDAPQSSDPIETHEAVISPLFREQNNFPQGVRANHAVEAIAESDDIARLHYGEMEIVFATRKIDQQQSTYVLLVIATRRAGERFQIKGGYRLYRSQQGTDIASDSLSAFRLLLERYGLEVSVGNKRAFFIPLASSRKGVVLGKGSGQFALSALTREGGGGFTEYGAVFAIDSGRYRSAVVEKRS